MKSAKSVIDLEAIAVSGTLAVLAMLLSFAASTVAMGKAALPDTSTFGRPAELLAPEAPAAR